MFNRVNIKKVFGSFSILLILVLFGMTASWPETASANSFLSGKTAIKNQQIQLTRSMIVYEDEKLAAFSAECLIDEQLCSPDSGLHPVGQVWQPNINLSNYAIYFDLGETYDLTQVFLHNVYDSKGVEVSVGEPGAWLLLTTAETSDFNTWGEYKLNVNSRYLRLRLLDPNVASINEVLLFANSASNEALGQKNAGLDDMVEFEPVDLENYNRNLYVQYDNITNDLRLNKPSELGFNFTIDIYNSNGNKLYSKEFINTMTAKLILNVSREIRMPGVYIVHYYNDYGVSKTIKFQKRR